MTVLESIKKGFSVAAQNLGLVLFLFVFGAGWNLTSLLFPQSFQNPTPAQLAVFLTLALFFIIVSVYLQAGSMGYVRDRLKGLPTSPASFAASARRYYFRFLGVGSVLAAIAGTFALIAILPLEFIGKTLPVVAIPVAVVASLVGIYFIIMMFLAPYIVVCKEERAIASLRQSMDFVKRNILSILGLFGILVAAGFVVGALLGAVYAVIPSNLQGTSTLVILTTLNSLVNAFLGVVVSGSFMAFYLGRSQDFAA